MTQSEQRVRSTRVVATWPAILKRLARPSMFDMIAFTLILTIATIFSTILINADGDMPRHLRVGEVLLDERSIIRVDQFSNTKFGEEFLPFEWGSEILFALAYRAGGLPGVSVMTGLIIGLTYGLVVLYMERRGVHPLLMLATVGMAILIAMVHWLPRPHIISALGVILLMFLMEWRNRAALWLVLPFFALWANLHGAFTWGLALLGLMLVGSAIEWRIAEDKAHWRDLTRRYGLLLALAVAGSLINPFTFELHAHIIAYLNEDYILSHTVDFAPPNFREIGPQVFMIAIALVLMGLAIARRRPAMPHLLVIVATLLFSLLALRNIPFFAIAALPLFAVSFDSTWRSFPFVTRMTQPEAQVGRRTGPGLLSVATVCIALAIAAAGGRIGSMQVSVDEFSNDRFPVAAVERARAAGLEGNMFNEFLWGGYIIYAWPEQRVYIDGQTAFYGEAITREYARIMALGPGWRDILIERNITFAIVPPNWPLAAELEREPSWSVWHVDDTAVILVREDSTAQH